MKLYHSIEFIFVIRSDYCTKQIHNYSCKLIDWKTTTRLANQQTSDNWNVTLLIERWNYWFCDFAYHFLNKNKYHIEQQKWLSMSTKTNLTETKNKSESTYQIFVLCTSAVIIPFHFY